MKTRWVLMSIILLLGSNTSKASNWEYLGSNTMSGEKYYELFDASRVDRKDKGRYISVWVKFVNGYDVDSVARAVVNEATLPKIIQDRGIKDNHEMPYLKATSDTLDSYAGAAMSLAIIEYIANGNYGVRVGGMEHIEFDRVEGKVRRLSIVTYGSSGEVYDSNFTKSKWTELLPDSEGERMLKVISADHR